MSGPRDEDPPPADPSWTTALSEAKSAARHLQQGTTALERLSRELAALRERSETTARLDLARALTDGPDGGALQALLTAAQDQDAAPDLRRTAEILLDRLTTTLGLEPIAQRGELLKLRPEDLAEMDLRGPGNENTSHDRELYCVVRPGWTLGAQIVVRPLLELSRESDHSRSATKGLTTWTES